MSNELAKYAGGLPASPEDLEAGLQNVQSTIQTSGGFQYLRLMKSGLFVYGQENVEVEEGLRVGGQSVFDPARLRLLDRPQEQAERDC